jgi:hypothetical protein
MMLNGSVAERVCASFLAPWLSCFAMAQTPQNESRPQLKLIQKIPMPSVQGRMDHLGIDVHGNRLFVAALGDSQNTVEVVDLNAGRRIFSIPGQSKPQGVFYSGAFLRRPAHNSVGV